MNKKTCYIRPFIRVVALSKTPILAGSVVTTSEDGEADAKSAVGTFDADETEEEAPSIW